MQEKELKKIVITQDKTRGTILNVDKGVKWSTFITGIEMMIECILENAEKEIDIDFILEDLKRIYERDRKENVQRETEKNN